MSNAHHHTPWSRRGFLRGAALGLFSFSLGGTPQFLRAAASASTQPGLSAVRRKTLVCIFQRGAMDGLSAVQPLNDPYLRTARPSLLLSPDASSRAGGALLKLDRRFGLHPELAPLLPFFREGRMAIVHGVGSPLNNRSHFDAQDYMESGTPGDKSTPTGWLNRAMGQLGHEASPFRAVSLTTARPRALFGDAAVLSVDKLADLRLSGSQEYRAALASLYGDDSTLGLAGQEGMEAIRLLESKQITAIPTGDGYPSSPLGTSLRQVAQLIKAEVGLEVAFTESNGWDSHSYQLGPFGGFTRNAKDLAQAIAAFWQDIKGYQDEVVLMTMTEFGRTVAQNGSSGTDHGRASCQFILGNTVNGGRIYGSVPTLVPENLADGRDLPVTTDFRAVFAAVARKHLGINDTQVLFPGYDGGLMNSLLR